MKWIFYRVLMQFAHRHGWHHAPRNPILTNDAGWHLHRCSWCGLSGFVMDFGKIDINAPIGSAPLVKEGGSMDPNSSIPSRA